MSKVYISKQGDTLAKIAARFYGDPALYTKILYANSLVMNPDIIPPGTNIIVPTIDFAFNAISSISDMSDAILQVDGQNITNFTSMKLNFSIDDVADRFSFSVPFDPNNENYKALFQPFTFKIVKIFIKNVLQLTGYIVNTKPSVSTSSKNLTLEGYSLTGVLNDCNYPPNSYPLQFKNVTLSDIVRITTNYFNLEMIDLVKDDYVFKDLDVSPDQKVYDFLSDLSKKRGVLLNSDAEGRLVIRKTTNEKAAFSLIEASPTIISCDTDYPGQEAFTTVTGLLYPKDEDEDEDEDETLLSDEDEEEKNTATAYTQEDKFMLSAGVSRSYVYKLDNIESGSIVDSVKAKLRRGWADRISYRLEVQDIFMPSGETWRENIRVNLYYPSVMIYKTFEFLVRNVTLNKDADKYTTELELVLPQSYNEDELESLPWLP